MKKLFDEPMSQVERNQRYREKNELVLFSARIKKELVDKLTLKLKREHKNKASFVREAIERYLSGEWTR